MKQPKFKFGDRLVCAEANEVFVVTNILQYPDSRFMYLPKGTSTPGNDPYDGGYWEDSLELYQEPKKKKLFAYISNGIVIFSIWEKSVISFNDEIFARCPMGDIEYPETNESEK